MSKKKIFIVDDNLFYANLLQNLLNEIEAPNVQIFRSGMECLKHIHHQPHIVFLDYNLPDINGIDVLKEIKQNYRGVHIVMLSGQEKLKVAVNALKLGATDYLIKGVDDNVESLEKILRDCEKIALS